MDNQYTDRAYACSCKQEAIEAFPFCGKLKKADLYGNGHINDTFLLVFENKNETFKYIMQRINNHVFTNPENLMENIVAVTNFIRKKMEKTNDMMWKTLQVFLTKEGKSFYKDSIGCYWRVYNFIENSTSYDLVEKKEDFYESAVAFGVFQNLLHDFPVKKLHETIPDFHNTKKRFDDCMSAVKVDKKNRVKETLKEIDFIKKHEEETSILMGLLECGEIPLRVTHNDTKLNNVMMDIKSGKGICVIDLDTVMPGSALYDFGDSIRFGASTAKEDEKNLSMVQCDMELFEAYTKGYLYGTQGTLTRREIELLPFGAKIMTLECGIRFLTDYLQGDNYFKIAYETHNIDRCRTQFKLVEDMENKWNMMQNIIEKYKN